MGKSYTSVDDFMTELDNALANYSNEVAEAVKRGVDKTAKETNQVIKSHATFKGKGDYIKAFALKTSFEDKHDKRKTWYVKPPYYRLTHLLEKGHALRNGKRSRKFPHIRYGEEYAKANTRKNIKEEIENGL